MTTIDPMDLANVSALLSVAVIGVRLIRSITRMEIKVDLLWHEVFGGPDHYGQHNRSHD